MTYKVITRSSAPGFRPQAEVIRRFRDFVWLQRRLRQEYRGESIGCRVVLLLCSAIEAVLLVRHRVQRSGGAMIVRVCVCVWAAAGQRAAGHGAASWCCGCMSLATWCG